MRVVALLACLLLVPAVTAQGGPSTGAYAGDVQQGDSDVRHYSTHGDTPCLAVYLPHTYLVTLATDPEATLSVRVGTKEATSQNGVASISFTANYCTAFDIYVRGVDVEGSAAYVLTVQHFTQGPGVAIA